MIIRLELPSHIPIISHIRQVRFFISNGNTSFLVEVGGGWDICVVCLTVSLMDSKMRQSPGRGDRETEYREEKD